MPLVWAESREILDRSTRDAAKDPGQRSVLAPAFSIPPGNQRFDQ
jgi:hypothetical protein